MCLKYYTYCKATVQLREMNMRQYRLSKQWKRRNKEKGKNVTLFMWYHGQLCETEMTRTDKHQTDTNYWHKLTHLLKKWKHSELKTKRGHYLSAQYVAAKPWPNLTLKLIHEKNLPGLYNTRWTTTRTEGRQWICVFLKTSLHRTRGHNSLTLHTLFRSIMKSLDH